MKCDICNEEEFVYGCTPNVAINYAWHCNNPNTKQRYENERFAEAISDLLKLTVPAIN